MIIKKFKKKMRKLIIIAIILVGNTSLFGQKSYKDPNNIYPFAPVTSSLLRYSETPVSNYTGVPNITIPIYTIKMKDYELPIVLSYHAGGVLVNDISGDVGLGWSLRTLDPITRKINGYVDEKGFMKSNTVQRYIDLEVNMNDNECIATINNIVNPTNISNSDLTSDDFRISIPDYSGEFKYNQVTNKFVTFPLSNINIDYSILDPNSSTTSLGGINMFSIIGTDGLKFEFGEDGREYNDFDRSIYYNGTIAWKIKRITDNANNQIVFDYISNTYARYNLTPQSLRFLQNPSDQFSSGGWQADWGNCDCPTSISSDSKQISGTESLVNMINFPDGRIEFNYSSRLDFTNLKKLDNIKIYDKNNVLISQKKFIYDYFTTVGAPGGLVEDISKKLKLVTFQEYDNKSNCINTNFDYYENSTLPQRNSISNDYWGYFNNYNGSAVGFGIPKTVINTWKYTYNNPLKPLEYINDLALSSDLLPNYTIIPNKNVNPSYISSYSLKSISYPEGGVNEFIYEPNLVSKLYNNADPNHYYFDAGAYPDMTKKYDSFSVSGYAANNQIYTGSPSPSSENSYSKTYTKEIDITKYERNFDMKIKGTSNFKASYFSNNLLPEALNALYNIYYYNDSNVKIYIVNSGDLNQSFTANYNKFNNQKIPNKKIYIDIIHVYWGGLNTSAYSSLPFFSNINIEWDEKKPNTNNVNFYGGGTRIKEIKIYDKNIYKKSINYSYVKEDGITSSGILFNLPVYKQPFRFGCWKKMVWGATNFWLGELGDYTEVTANPVIPGMTTQGNTTGYDRVQVNQSDINGNTIGKEIFNYRIENSFISGDNVLAALEQSTLKYNFYENQDWKNGLLLSHFVYRDDNTLLKKTVNEYDANLPNANPTFFTKNTSKSILYNLISPIYYNSPLNPSFENHPFQPAATPTATQFGIFGTNISRRNSNSRYIPIFVKHSDALLLKKSTITEYFNGNELIITENYNYNSAINPISLTSKTTFNSLKEILESKFYYPQDLATEPFMSNMISANRIGAPIKTEQLKNGIKTAEEKFVYGQDQSTNNLLLPKSVYSAKFPNSNPNITAPPVGELEKKVTYNQYDDKGNLLQYTPESGISVSIIWGYNKTQPIAKIENATYDQVVSYVANLQSLSDLDVDSASEATLLGNLNALRTTLPNAMVTTYTYNLLVGVTSITDAKGLTSYYEYDSFNRLKFIKDQYQNILQRNCYNYKGQVIDCSQIGQAILAPPTGLSLSSATSSSLDFTWIAVTGATGYKIYKNGVYVNSTTIPSGSLSGLTASMAYGVQVLAYNGAGDGALCSTVSMTTSTALTNTGSIYNNTGYTISAGTMQIIANGNTMCSLAMPALAAGATFNFSTGYSSPIFSNGTFVLKLYSATVGIAGTNYFNMISGSSSTNGYFSNQGWGWQATVTSTGAQYVLSLKIN